MGNPLKDVYKSLMSVYSPNPQGTVPAGTPPKPGVPSNASPDPALMRAPAYNAVKHLLPESEVRPSGWREYTKMHDISDPKYDAKPQLAQPAATTPEISKPPVPTSEVSTGNEWMGKSASYSRQTFDRHTLQQLRIIGMKK